MYADSLQSSSEKGLLRPKKEPILKNWDPIAQILHIFTIHLNYLREGVIYNILTI